ncbi:MAG: 2-amino-4-hydroxy-6-hydroxymethyldihydropteridine diphosphokinase [Enterobacterales bacterium]|nr:2-amino-4-hydroxy-6-hydroxymethyldihydropteridine diphosphokinase [Enterobacterales bacterium]
MMPTANTVYIGLGSNLNQPQAQLNQAIEALKNLTQSHLIKHSSFYLSPPMGPTDQNDYINAVVELKTYLQPLALLDQLQAIEKAQGRVRNKQRWGARTLDLDLLLYGQQVIQQARLEVPHYGIKQRAFVVLPLLEIAPSIELPNFGPLNRLTQKLANQEITKL